MGHVAAQALAHVGSMHLEVLAEVLLVYTILLALCATFLFALYAALLAFRIAIL